MRDPLLQVTPRSSEMTCHEELCPTVFSSKTETIKIINQLRSSQSNQLIVPPVKLSTYGPRSFAVAGPIPSGIIYLNICVILNFQ